MVGKLKQNLLLACLVISSVTVFYLGQHAMECHHRIEERSQPVKLESTKATVRTSLDPKVNKTFAYHKDMPLIFIGGVPRSGTTLMRAMLDAHPDIRCGEETRVIPRILALKQMWSRSSKEKIRLDEAGVTDEVLDSAMQAFLLEIIVKHGEPAPYLCNKDPFALKSLTYLARLFPNAKFLLMVRDGRASVHSMISRKVTIAGFDLNSYRDCLAKWNRAIETMYNQCMEVGHKKCMLVHYEQLVLHPERWMRTLLKFLHIPWNHSVLHHEEMIGKAGGVSLSKSTKENSNYLTFLRTNPRPSKRSSRVWNLLHPWRRAADQWSAALAEEPRDRAPSTAPVLSSLNDSRLLLEGAGKGTREHSGQPVLGGPSSSRVVRTLVPV
ncbi:protein-tyrosine sulfotransferase 1 isoform X1 [Sciurus carolinensis]|uniref:protein-tyrosine sulfotransferase 1 isoform X1 n=1 Tax=Sciurus carolinensis TaxID=30640 RepID=UPI001FB2F4ED|nr:protein-tyrosine sulfotransferase 1 isoform X1 [Sciurus carolinensis]XP_047389794.1 protein-tyrosine sulfotransferase 1 isoform X1 [Sciurus carolinensis]XP_047389795.1 protein-tyrosine sulfotransferase 1 isoform X1 [Sciurus carolinensis]